METVSDRESRWRLIHDVVVFQVKLALETLLDLTLIPASLAAAGVDLVLGNWRRPHLFHALLRFGERCERRLDLWGAGAGGEHTRDSDIDALVRSIETLMRQPGTGQQRIRELRRWAALKLAPREEDEPPPGSS